MGLKQDIVIVSRFGNQAARTPEKYIERYTSRLGATEGLTPYTDPSALPAYISAYMARKDSNDRIIRHTRSPKVLEDNNERITPQSSRLFGNRGLVYREVDLKEAIRMTEKANREKHTIILPVISFTFDFLKKMGVLSDDLKEVKNRGDYHGRVDQLKLRRAVSKAVQSLCKKLHMKVPEWTGAIHVDTKSVHCHLTLIETSSDVPKERFVWVPKKETKKDSVTGRVYEEFVRDENGKAIMENLGERGKLTEVMKEDFRHQLERELFYLKNLTPFVNNLSPHKQIVKEKTTQLFLSHSQFAKQIIQIYEALPKGDGSEQSLVEAQDTWRGRTNRHSMKRANTLARQFVRRVLNDYRDDLGFDDFLDSVKQFAQYRYPDTQFSYYHEERRRIEEVSVRRLELELVNRLYQFFKNVRVVKELGELPELVVTNNAFELTDKVKGELSTVDLRLTTLGDQQVRDLLADSFEGRLPKDLGRALALEHRSRFYGERLEFATNQTERYGRLLRDYDRLVMDERLSEDTRVVRDFYEFNKDYYQGVKDKYDYLCLSTVGTYLSVNGRFYHKPSKDDEGSFDWDTWLKNYKLLLEHRNHDVKYVYPLSLHEDRQYQKTVPKSLRDFCGDNAFYQRELLQIVLQTSALDKRIQDVSKERFEEVKSYDLSELIYDLDPHQTRKVDDTQIMKFQELMTERARLQEGMLEYMRDTGQDESGFILYRHYEEQLDVINKSRDIGSQVLLSGELPKPVREQDSFDEDLADLKERLVLPVDKALSLVDGFVNVADYELDVVTKDVRDKGKKYLPTENVDMLDELTYVNESFELFEDEDERETTSLLYYDIEEPSDLEQDALDSTYRRGLSGDIPR